MKSIKVKPGETFKLIITEDDGNEMTEQCYQFDPGTIIKLIRKGDVFVQMDLVPTINYSILFAESKLFGQNKEKTDDL